MSKPVRVALIVVSCVLSVFVWLVTAGVVMAVTGYTPASQPTVAATTEPTSVPMPPAPAPSPKPAPLPAPAPKPAPAPAAAPAAPAVDPETIHRMALIITLDKEGVYYTSPDDAVTAAKSICKALGDGSTMQDVAANIVATIPGDSRDNALKLAGAGIGAYCPQYLSEVQN